jgi:thiamine biosynthesis lipoprotein
VIRGSFFAMGTTVEVWSVDEVRWQATRRYFAEMEARLSRFLPDSDLQRLNRDPRPVVPVAGPVAELLAAADHLRATTGGLVDVGVGGPVAAWGYDRTFSEVTDRSDGPADLDMAWRFDAESALLYRRPGVLIDLGGIAKGWTADRAVEQGLAVVASAGGDIRSDDPRTVATVEDGLGGIAGRVAVGRGGLATSSTRRRRWRVGGVEVSHLIHPGTGRPVRSPIVSATAVADTSLLAEAAAKAVLLQGADGLAWADRTPWVRGAAVVWHDGNVYATAGVETAA